MFLVQLCNVSALTYVLSLGYTMRYALTILCLYCFLHDVAAQNFMWGSKWGNVKSDKATTVKTDPMGFIYVTGYFSTGTTFGTNNLQLTFTANATSKEVFVAKFDSTGVCLWAKSGGQYFDDRALGMDIDALGNVTVTGTFWEGSGIQFDGNYITGNAFGGGDQCFVVHFSTTGTYLWGGFICSDGGDDQGLDIATDKYGNHFICGFMSGQTLFVNGGTVTATNANALLNIQGWNQGNCFWLAKLDAGGVPQWARTFGRQPYDPLHSKYVERDIALCLDDTGGVYVAGGFEKETTFNSINDTSTGGYDLFIIKYDAAGNHQWTQLGGSDKDDWINGIAYDELGNLYVAGEHRDSLFYDNIIIKNYNKRDAFVMKVECKTGKAVWGKRMGGPLGSERANDVYADANCNVYVCGDIQAGGKFNDEISVPAGGSVQSFIARMNPDGKFLWAITGGGSDSNDRCNSVVKGAGAQVYACGFFRSPASFGNISLTSVGSSDAYLLRIHDSLAGASASIKFARLQDSVVCPGGTVYLAIPPHKYLDINPKVAIAPNSDTSVIALNPSVTTTYAITGIAGDLCESYDTMIFTVVIAPLPDAAVSVSPSAAVLIDSLLVTATSTGTGATSYQWYYGDLPAGNGTSVQQQYYFANNDFGTFCFTLVATSIEGCIDSAKACVTISRPERTEVPNAFTPNGDNNNDEFRPVFIYTDLSQLRGYNLEVYDRFGTFLYESTDPTKGWRGVYPNGGIAEVGTYWYTIRYVDVSGKSNLLKGDFTLIR
jgi:gliding motility-associated-like protein